MTASQHTHRCEQPAQACDVMVRHAKACNQDSCGSLPRCKKWKECYNAHPTELTAALVAGSISVMSGFYVYKLHKRRELRVKMEARGARAKRDIEELKQELKGLKINGAIVKMSFQQLQEALQSGKLSASEVLRAYQVKALEVNDRTNAITDVIKSAKVQAAKLDTLDPSLRGPLHGIPISLKETCGLKGLDCTSGFPELIDIPLKEDSPLIQVLKLKGAVPFIRTNIPEGMRK
ncbi:fatty-acid amide hydrolase [Elysia marginata]|uniref:Fatty-acid amide hydrolase n=1 Tax=Elysia marginata TaxID=1093978 RepID=A0AAV4GLG0_9GAST|nr:fatty-acid amide hydrolase [Elysia marginata]